MFERRRYTQLTSFELLRHMEENNAMSVDDVVMEALALDVKKKKQSIKVVAND